MVPVRFDLDTDDKERMEQVVSADPFYAPSNIRYLEGLMEDVKAGRAHFVRHDLIEVD